MMDLYISSDGMCRAIYDESLDLRSLGTSSIKRASHVEPSHDGQWTADLSPVCGPQLGPFPARSQALKAEIDWLGEWFHRSGGVRK